jgi:hypothetical protein
MHQNPEKLLHAPLTTTEIAGATHATQFGYDVGDNVKRIVKINVNHGLNIDGLQVTYELTNGLQKEMPWVGYRKGEHNHTVGPLAFDEEISAIKVGVGSEMLMRRLAFYTTKGRRFPESETNYYGRGHKDEVLDYTTIEVQHPSQSVLKQSHSPRA